MHKKDERTWKGTKGTFNCQMVTKRIQKKIQKSTSKINNRKYNKSTLNSPHTKSTKCYNLQMNKRFTFDLSNFVSRGYKTFKSWQRITSNELKKKVQKNCNWNGKLPLGSTSLIIFRYRYPWNLSTTEMLYQVGSNLKVHIWRNQQAVKVHIWSKQKNKQWKKWLPINYAKKKRRQHLVCKSRNQTAK